MSNIRRDAFGEAVQDTRKRFHIVGCAPAHTMQIMALLHAYYPGYEVTKSSNTDSERDNQLGVAQEFLAEFGFNTYKNTIVICGGEYAPEKGDQNHEEDEEEPNCILDYICAIPELDTPIIYIDPRKPYAPDAGYVRTGDYLDNGDEICVPVEEYYPCVMACLRAGGADTMLRAIDRSIAALEKNEHFPGERNRDIENWNVINLPPKYGL